VQGMEDLVRRVGGCSGRDGDKVSRLDLPLCAPGWMPDKGESCPAVAGGCIAHVVARVEYVPCFPLF